MKHEIDNEALNSAGWKFVAEYEERVGEQCPPLLFNHLKGILEHIIQHYLFKSGLVEPEKPPLFHIGQKFKVGGIECILAQSAPFKVCLIDINSGNRWYDAVHVANSTAITQKEMMDITAGSEYEVI